MFQSGVDFKDLFKTVDTLFGEHSFMSRNSRLEKQKSSSRILSVWINHQSVNVLTIKPIFILNYLREGSSTCLNTATASLIPRESIPNSWHITQTLVTRFKNAVWNTRIIQLMKRLWYGEISRSDIGKQNTVNIFLI